MPYCTSLHRSVNPRAFTGAPKKPRIATNGDEPPQSSPLSSPLLPSIP
jgi:hypothetical protein